MSGTRCMQEIRLDQLQRTHAAMSMWGSAPFPRAHSGLFYWKKDPVPVGKKCYEREHEGLFPQQNPKPTSFSIWGNVQSHDDAIMHHDKAVVSGTGPCSAVSAPPTAAYPIHRASPQQCNSIQKPSCLLSQSTEQPTQLFSLCEGGPEQWHLRMALNLVISLTEVCSRTGKYSPNIIRAKTWQPDRAV